MAHLLVGVLVKVRENEGNALAEENHVDLSVSSSIKSHVVVSRLHGTLHGGGNEEAGDSVEIEGSVALNAVHVNVILLHNRCVGDEGPKSRKTNRICSLP